MRVHSILRNGLLIIVALFTFLLILAFVLSTSAKEIGADPRWNARVQSVISGLASVETAGAWIGLAVTLVVGWLAYHHISNGCSALAEGAQEFSKGNLLFRIAYSRKNELGEVAAAFNAMAAQLQVAEQERAKQQELAESLLLNVLPGEVANELKQKGAVDPRYHEDVTILFTDFKGFTLSTEQLPAEELVKALHEYFTAFDTVAQKYGLEKLKTIGDSYMAVAGLPERRASHAVDAVLAAFEIVDSVLQGHARGLPPWTIRVGVHTGPVVSGVVGIRKFAFDIWGESVNFASRMESSGAPNRVNLSASTYTRVKDFFDCEYRGRVPTKEGREFDMYFAIGALSGLRQSADVQAAFAARYKTYFQHDLAAFPATLLSTAKRDATTAG